jgi:hypothetical protein
VARSNIVRSRSGSLRKQEIRNSSVIDRIPDVAPP